MMLFVALIEIPLMLIALVAVKVFKALGQAAAVKKAKPVKKEIAATLSEEQRNKIVTAILESALLTNDSCMDALLNEGEGVYPASEACNSAPEDFELQYGTKEWSKAWVHALGKFFDCEAEYIGDGNFHVYGKEV